MRVFITLSAIIATVLAQDPPTITETPSSDFGNWDISMTYASVNTGAYTRNLTAIYTNTPDNIWIIIDCIEQAGPGVEQVDFCTNPEFSYELDGESKYIYVCDENKDRVEKLWCCANLNRY